MDSEATRGRSSIPIAIGIGTGTRVELLAGKALYWPDFGMLCIADAHFGKAATYRALGQPVPGGTTASNLARIDALLAKRDVATLVFLGDLFHAKSSLTADIVGTMADWRRRHAALQCVLVRGNHDRRAGPLPTSLGIETVGEPLLAGPFALCHSLFEHPTHHVIAGHIHPVIELRGIARQSLRLPCFVTGDRTTVLPSFGDFTGGYDITLAEGDSAFVTDGTSIWPMRPLRSQRWPGGL